ncbi:c-type cytochrome [Alteromonas oceanisediminis]|uniref:c-type cytochrome n=1 Tax=Alteromonas oceanisediminis TaxID=2836180 RepID=UPI001BD999AF|nr:cytochrome c [Alteromonas oceanisediminis]MBT0588026.1 c-type cytochrome [Alteromonas oceanisediminis]
MMKNQLTVTIFVLFATLLTSLHVSSTEPLSGAELINNNCARCHNSRPIQEFSMSEWKVIMPHMREKANLTGAEVQAILEFMEIATTPAQAMNVKEVVNLAADPKEVLTRYGCQGCHQVQGAGGTLGPSLDNVISEKGRAFFLRKVKEPQFNNSSSAMPQMPITDDELEALAEFLSSK